MNFCRICVQAIVGESINLFSNNEESKEIMKKIFVFSQVHYSDAKSFSEICSVCLGELDVAYNFHLKCINSDQKLRYYLLKQKQQETIDYPDKKKEDFKEINSDEDTQLSNSIPCEKSLVISPFTDPSSEIAIRSVQCEICDKFLKTESSLINHKLRMHQNRKHIGKVTGFGAARRYHCTECAYSTPHSQTLVNHFRKHSGERPYHCYCGKKFTQSSALATHSKTHSSTTYYTCTVCGKQFKHAFSLKKHFKVHEEGSYQCIICKKLLKSKDTLQDHMHRHNNVRNYNCEECGDTFITSSELINHRKKHKSDKNFECHLCGYKSHTKKLLSLHIKRHTGDKSYKCELCAVSFITLGELHTHKRVHTREKPYSCPTCSQRFMHSSSVNKHMRNVHGIIYKWGEFKHNLMNQIKQLF